MFVAMLRSKELKINEKPWLMKKRFFVGGFKNKNKKLKKVVKAKLLKKTKK